MILKDLLELMDEDEEITVLFSREKDEKDSFPSVTGPVWTMPWRFTKKEVQRVTVFDDRVLIIIENEVRSDENCT